MIERDWLPLSEDNLEGIGLFVRRTRMLEVARAVAERCGVSVSMLISQRRCHDIAHPRQLAMLIMKERCLHCSFPQIGRFFSRDHTTVITGCKAARKRIEEVQEWQDSYLAVNQCLDELPGYVRPAYAQEAAE